MKQCVMCALLMLCAVPAVVLAQVDHDALPEPSFWEFSDWNHRYPETDVNVDLYKHSWRDSDKFVAHGGFVEAAYLTPGDPLNPSEQGAVLKYLKAYNHGTLESGQRTKITSHDSEQVFFYILSGTADVTSRGRTEKVWEGSGVFVPAGVEYEFVNTGDDALETVIIVEDITDDFVPLTEIKVGNYHDNGLSIGMHWVNIWHPIVEGVKFSNPMGIGVVTVPEQEIQQPHVHHEGTEEIWCKIGDDCLIMFDKVLRWHREGEAYVVPPNGKSPHMAINHSDKPTQFLYIGNRHDDRPESLDEPTDNIHPSPLPSFQEMSKWNHRYPNDPKIDMYLHSWKHSHLHVGHGGFVERAVLTKGDPLNPTEPGAVLKFIKEYDHGSLEANCYTEPTLMDGEQTFFFVTRGEGRVEANGKGVDIREGSGIFMPEGQEYQFFNTANYAMEVVIVTEEVGKEHAFTPLSEMQVGNYHDHPPRTGMHWAHIARAIVDNVKFYNPMAFAAVFIDPFDIAQPHLHTPDTEEIWYMVQGTSLNFFGKQLRWMEPGTAFLVPPNSRSIQCSINHTDEPMMWLYMGNRRDQYEPGNEQRDIEQGSESTR